jgi:hypothetical protein
MEMTKKEVREENKDVRQPEIDSAKNRIILYTPHTPRFLTRFDLTAPPNAERRTLNAERRTSFRIAPVRRSNKRP